MITQKSYNFYCNSYCNNYCNGASDGVFIELFGLFGSSLRFKIFFQKIFPLRRTFILTGWVQLNKVQLHTAPYRKFSEPTKLGSHPHQHNKKDFGKNQVLFMGRVMGLYRICRVQIAWISFHILLKQNIPFHRNLHHNKFHKYTNPLEPWQTSGLLGSQNRQSFSK